MESESIFVSETFVLLILVDVTVFIYLQFDFNMDFKSLLLLVQTIFM